jgi:hypothetical protein
MDFFLWGSVKDEVYMKNPLNMNQFCEYIVEHSMILM